MTFFWKLCWRGGTLLLGASLLACEATPQLGNASATPRPSSGVPAASVLPSPAAGSVAAVDENTVSPYNPSLRYTSVVIDARGIKVGASMSPTIVSEGQELFPGPGEFDPEQVINVGLAAFVYGSMDEALRDTRAGSTPLVLKAIAPDGRWGVRLSRADGEALRASQSREPFLKNFRVVFLLDK
ncbi:MAG: hypothetical protein ACO1RX_14870 [Candidatus Sericytochromatia bacterium]